MLKWFAFIACITATVHANAGSGPPRFLWAKLDSFSFFYHPDFNRRCWNFTSSTAEPLTLVAQTSLANQMADSSGRGL